MPSSAYPSGDAGAGDWTPFGDPTLSGWLITIGYFVAAWYCLQLSRPALPEQAPAVQVQVQVVRGARQIGGPQPKPSSAGVSLRERITWTLLAWCLFALGANKQLDLQTAFIDLSRWLLTTLDLRSARDWISMGFLSVLLLVLGGFIALIALLVRKLGKTVRIAVAGLAWLFAFVLLRALQLQHLPGLVGDSWAAAAFEAIGIATVYFAARLQLRRRAPQRRPAR